MQNYHRITANIDLLPNMTWRFSDFQKVLSTNGAGPVTGRIARKAPAPSPYLATPKRTRTTTNPLNPATGKPKRGRPAKSTAPDMAALGV